MALRPSLEDWLLSCLNTHSSAFSSSYLGLSIYSGIYEHEQFPYYRLGSDFFPVLVSFLRKLPVVGDFLNMPGVAHVIYLWDSLIVCFTVNL